MSPDDGSADGAAPDASHLPPPPEGTLEAPGAIRQILAFDRDRAVVVFAPYTGAGLPTPTLALMHRDGRIGWSVPLDHNPLRARTSTGIEIVTVVAMYRHATNTAWNVSVSFHDPSRPLRRFASRPTTADLDAFIDQSDFELIDSWGRLLAGNLIDSSWVAATGERPTRHFPAGIEQAD